MRSAGPFKRLSRAIFPLLGVLSLCAAARPSVALFPVIGRPSGVEVAGLVLLNASSGKSTLRRNVDRLLADTWAGATVRLSFEGQTQDVTSDEEGHFHTVFTPQSDAPFTQGIRWLDAAVSGEHSRGPVEIVPDDAPFLVISDFDDTIAISNVTHTRGLLTSAFFREGDTQLPVAGMPELYRCLRQDKPKAPGLALVSGSPLGFVARTSTFLTKNQFPFMGLYLRNLHFSTLADYKQPVIRRLLEQFPQKALCFGDSGEKDPEVYSQIRKEFPARVAEIYIHLVTPTKNPHRFDGMITYTDPRDAAVDAVKKGYLSQACLDSEFKPQEVAK